MYGGGTMSPANKYVMFSRHLLKLNYLDFLSPSHSLRNICKEQILTILTATQPSPKIKKNWFGKIE